MCNGCGNDFQLISKTEIESSIDPYDLIEEINENFINVNNHYDDFHLWIPNISKKINKKIIPFCYQQDSTEVGFRSISSEDISLETDLFKKAFEKEIMKIEKSYGKDKVEIHWGEIKYYL